MMISFSGSHFPKDVILYAVFFYVRYAVSYRDLEEIMAERGVTVDHATLNRWVIKYSPLISSQAQRRKSGTSTSWRMDETYIKVRGKWTYYYRAVDKHVKTLDFMLSVNRDKDAATDFFKKTIQTNGFPDKVVIDKSGANLAGLHNINCQLIINGWVILPYLMGFKSRTVYADHRAHKGLNNAIEVSHRPTRKREKIFGRFKSHRQAQRFLSAHDQINLIFRPRRYQLTTISYRHARSDAFSLWNDYTAKMVA